MKVRLETGSWKTKNQTGDPEIQVKFKKCKDGGYYLIREKGRPKKKLKKSLTKENNS